MPTPVKKPHKTKCAIDEERHYGYNETKIDGGQPIGVKQACVATIPVDTVADFLSSSGYRPRRSWKEGENQ